MKASDVIKSLQSTNSRLDKEAILLDAWNKGCIDFFRGALLAYDPLISFGVKQIPKITDMYLNGMPPDPEVTFYHLANKLIIRQVTGYAARDAILAFTKVCDAELWELFYSKVLTKDLRAGVSESTINKVLKKIGKEAEQYIIQEFPYQRCCLPKDAKLKEFSWEDGVVSQLKSDGMFVNVNFTDEGVALLSRSGKPFPLEEFEGLVTDAASVLKLDTQTHGELLVYRDGKELPREIGNGILNSVAQGKKFDSGDTPVYIIWDQIPLTSVISKGKCLIPYSTRLKEITKQLESKTIETIKLVETRIVHTLEDATEHYRELLALGFEGTIIKEPTSIWKDGTSKFQVKLKQEAECDLEIVGFNAGNGKNAVLFGSLIVKTSDGLLEVGISGFKDEQRKNIWSKRDELIGTIITIRGNGLMKPTSNNGLYSIFLPRFVEHRLDKTVADDLQKVKDQFEQALK